MKFSKLFLVAALAASSMSVSAGNVDATTARAAAKAFFNQRVNTTQSFKAASSADIKLAYTQQSKVEGNAYYVFNVKGGGWVIIAGDDRANQVLAYSDQGSLDMNNLPENTQAYLNMYQKQIEGMQASKFDVTPTLKAPKRANPVAPLLRSINWAQQGPFNLQCPEYNGSRSSVGCAALAMAQIVYYWQYPQTMPALSGYMNSYYFSQVPSLPAREINYDLIRPQYAEFNEEGRLQYVEGVTDEEKQEVAWFCRYCAQACVMNFSPDGSGSNVLKQKNAFLTLGYSDNAKLVGIEAWPSRETWNTTDYTDAQWVELMTAQLEAGRPIPYSMEDIGDGHAFVVDGIDADGLFHVSWGWYGRGDGWFQYGAFNVTVQGQYMEFNTALFMTIDLYPYEGYVPPVGPVEPQVEIGDADEDGVIGIADVTAITDYILTGIDSEINMTAADVDKDGVVGIADVTAILDYILNEGW